MGRLREVMRTVAMPAFVLTAFILPVFIISIRGAVITFIIGVAISLFFIVLFIILF